MEVSQTTLQSTHKQFTPAVLDLLLLDKAVESVRLMEPGVGRSPCVSLTCNISGLHYFGNVLLESIAAQTCQMFIICSTRISYLRIVSSDYKN